MKSLLIVGLFVLASVSNAAQRATTEFAPLNHLFVPTGFDQNDQTEVIVTGLLPNPCYERLAPKVKVVGRKVNISLMIQKRPKRGDWSEMCADVVVPFTQSIKVGHLMPGSYDIAVNEQSQTKQIGKVGVKATSSAAVDDYPYAIVQYVEQNRTDLKFYLHGYLYSDCFVLDGVHYVTNKSDVIAVLPTMKRVRSPCVQTMVPFRQLINPPLNTLTSPYFLLHVRSADGQSVNFVGYKK